jgi:hypothetical protein
MSYTDWIPNFERLQGKEDKTILELGCGEGTKYLVNNFKKVYSFEVVRDDYWYNFTKKDLQDYDNWESIYYPSDFINKADELLVKSRGKDRDTKPLEEYFEKLNQFVDLKKIDIAFVDQGNHFRAESANYFMNIGVPLIIIHDSKNYPNGTDVMYGYDNIKHEQYDYWYISFTLGQGTTMFFNRKYYPQQ